MLSEGRQHVSQTWEHVLRGNSTPGEKLEVGVEAAVGLAGVAVLGKLGFSGTATNTADMLLPKLAVAEREAPIAVRNAMPGITHSTAALAPMPEVATAQGVKAFTSYFPPLKEGMVRLYRGETYPTFAERLKWRFLPSQTAFSDAHSAGLFYSPDFETARIYADRALKENGTSRIVYLDLQKNKALDKYVFENVSTNPATLERARRRMSEAERLKRTEEIFSGQRQHPEITVPRRFRNSGQLVPPSVYQSVAPSQDSLGWIDNTWAGRRFFR